MLVLSRKPNQFIDITVGDVQIELCCVEVRGDKVRLGISAPQSVTVHRREVTDAIAAQAKRRGPCCEDCDCGAEGGAA